MVMRGISLALVKVMIKETENYEQFKKLKANRDIDKSNLKGIVESISKHGQLTPIIVDNDMRVIDGQHRLEALKILKKPVKYEVKDGFSIEQVREINSNSKKWSVMDYVKSYEDEGSIDYQLFHLLVDRFSYQSKVIGAALGIYEKLGENIKSGKLSFSTKDYEDATQLLTKLEKVEEVFDESVEITSNLRCALLGIFRYNLYDFDKFINRMRINSSCINRKAKVIDYVREIQDAYNKGLSEEYRVYIENKYRLLRKGGRLISHE